MDDDHEFPPGHFARCLEAIESDPTAIWLIGEWLADEGRAEPAPCPGELHPRGFSVVPRDPDRCAALADGSTIFPRAVFERGVRYPDEFTFGIVYLELAARLAHLGYKIRHLPSTWIVHVAGPARSISDPEMEEAARIYSMLCLSFLYRRTLRNRVQTLLELVRRLVFGGPRTLRALRRARRAYLARRRELHP